ncbi:MAG: energy transducer TonB [Saprospiraceae bacterium]|jgi:protein TonB|nr:energy transducer TonB [Saprospiraceae bacterium]MDA9357952.1 energy transducer TonB [Saprospiraceae bacterium]MDA9866213.1 energy transducer TonB [Saprospiraceae bacterium]MDC1305383.1 energy transducer TonB [Saprospiraceae bacterium]MDG1101607.1 energy transducer TonB [Saprospiraceae bacterium]
MKNITLSIALTLLAFSIYAQTEQNQHRYKENNEIFKVVEEMPRFPGCEEKKLSKDALKECSNNKLSMFIGKNLKYPKDARESSVQGKAIIQFVVNKQGKLQELKLLRDPGSGCGDAALEVIKKMKDEITWIPGKQRGQKVKVQFTLPITFKL